MLRCLKCHTRRFQVRDDFTLVCDECGAQIDPPSEIQRHAQYLQDLIGIHMSVLARLKEDLMKTYESARTNDEQFASFSDELLAIYTDMSTLENRLGLVHTTLRQKFQISGRTV